MIATKARLVVFASIVLFSMGIISGCGGASPASSMPSSGDNAEFSASTDSNFITATKEQFDELSNFAQKGNTSGIQDMLNSGIAVEIPKGTHVEVLDTGWDGSAEIKIMDGTLAGQQAYTFLNALVRDGQ